MFLPVQQGWDRLFADIGTEWGTYIANTQPHRYVAGIRPIRALVNVASGVIDLIAEPVAHYRANRRLLRGLRKGALSFISSLTTEATLG